MTIEAVSVGAVPLFEPEGAIDITNSAELRDAMLAQAASGARAIVLDLAAVRYVDSSGLSALVSAATSLERDQGQLFLCNVDAAVMKVLEMTRLTEYFAVEVSRESALEHAASLGD